MRSEVDGKGSKAKKVRLLAFISCGSVLMAVFCMWATADRNWEQSWKYRIRVETPLGSDKALVLSWLRQHCEFIPHVDAICEDTLDGIPVLVLAGVQASDVASYSRSLVRRSDLVAGKRDHMRVYHFFDSNGKVVGHFTLPFHEIAEYERSNQLLAAR